MVLIGSKFCFVLYAVSLKYELYSVHVVMLVTHIYNVRNMHQNYIIFLRIGILKDGPL